MKETNLKKWRAIRNMTQKELAEKAGISLRTLQDYEQGRKSINGAAALTVCKLADELVCEPFELLEDED
jgi:transcriptional regulator with XRE-family HTH domain